MLECSKAFRSKRKKANLKKKAYGIAGAFYTVFGRVRRFTELVHLLSQLLVLFLFVPTTGLDVWMTVSQHAFVSEGRVVPTSWCQGRCVCA